MKDSKVIAIEDKHTPPFFNRTQISIERGEGVHVWDEEGKKYLDFTSGWGVTCLGHAHPAISDALLEQSRKIIQNPNTGLTYSPARARLLSLMSQILPQNLTRIFFSNSGAEANDAAIKLARKVSGRLGVISTDQSFHGRTISTASATGQVKHRDKFNPLMPNYRFVPYDDVNAIANALDSDVAAVILEPIQGEGGVHVPSDRYLEEVSALCAANRSLLIIDEIQTGFCRTGPMFAISSLNVKADFLTMAKGIAGGFPLGAFAISEEISDRLEKGDHGGTYCGNPLGCAVAYAVIKYLMENNITRNVETMGDMILERMRQWQRKYPKIISDVRGKGLLTAMELHHEEVATQINRHSLNRGLLINVIQGKIVRVFPALNITREETEEGLRILEAAIQTIENRSN